MSENGKNLWFRSGNTLLKMDLFSGTTSTLQIPEDKLIGLNLIFSVIEFDRSTWFFGFDAMLRYKEDKWHMYPFKNKPQPGFSINHKNGKFWYYSGDHVYGLDLMQSPFTIESAVSIVIGKFVKSVFLDNTGILWIGKDAFGLRKFNPIRSFQKLR